MSKKSQNMSFPHNKFSGKPFNTLVGFKVVYFEMPNKNIGAEFFACVACGIVTLSRFRWGRVEYPRGEWGLIHVGFALHPYSDWLLQLVLTNCEKLAALKIAKLSGRRNFLRLSAASAFASRRSAAKTSLARGWIPSASQATELFEERWLAGLVPW